MFTHAVQRGFALGAKHGIVEGYKRYMAGEAAPEMDESAMQGAIGIIVGSISYSVSSGNIRLSSTWNTTISNIDTQAQATFNLSNVLPIAIIGVGILMIVIGAFAGPGI
jgi:hypothetical protein